MVERLARRFPVVFTALSPLKTMTTKHEKLPKRWQDCEPFVAALKSRGYLTADDRVVMSDGVYLYMY